MLFTRDLYWLDYFHEILTYVNNFLLVLIGVAFGVQIFFVLLFFLKKKTFPKAKNYHKFAIIIAAKNEEDVIYKTVKELLDKQKYPKDKFDIFVVANNCTDNTAKLAEKAGAKVFIYNDNNPKHQMVSYPLKYGFDEILKIDNGYECFIRFDADNLADENFISIMNDAFESGVECARCYENSSNFNQNRITKCMALYYMRDCRLSSRVRERVGLSSMINGPGMMVSTKIIKQAGGWDAMSLSEDAEFGINRMFDGVKVHFVEDAIVYEDQASTFKDTWNRLVRIGHGLNSLFWKKGPKMIFKFLMTLNVSFLDLFLQLFFIPMAFLCCTWIPLFYIFDFIYYLVLAPNAPNMEYITLLLKIIGFSLLFAFYLIFVLQALMIILLEHKRIKNFKFKNYIGTVLLFPFFMIFDCITIFFGVVSRPKWKSIKRNKL